MEFITNNWMLLLVALTSGGALLWPVFKGGLARGGLGPNQAVTLINRERAVVIDVRMAEEFAQGHIVGAKNLPLDSFPDALPKTAKKKDLPLILVCATGLRSGKAVKTATDLGYTQVHNLAGGMGAWQAASMPVEKS